MQHRLNARKEQEAEQLRMREKFLKLKERGKGEKVWAGQMRLPTRAAEAKEPWGETGVERKIVAPVTCKLVFPNTAVDSVEAGPGFVEFRHSSATFLQEGTKRWAVEVGKAKRVVVGRGVQGAHH